MSQLRKMSHRCIDSIGDIETATATKPITMTNSNKKESKIHQENNSDGMRKEWNNMKVDEEEE